MKGEINVSKEVLMNEDIFEKLPIGKAIAKLAIPTMMGQLSTVVYNMVDTFFVAKTNSPNQIAAVTLSMPIVLILASIGALFGMGGGSYVSRLLGLKEGNKIKNTSSFCFWVSVFISIPILIIGLLSLNSITKITGANLYDFNYTKEYLMVIFIGAPWIILSNMLIQIIRSEGNAKDASLGLIIGMVINCILNPALILGMGWGVIGSAIATITGNVINVLYYFVFFIKGRTILSISAIHLKKDLEVAKNVIIMGIPAALVPTLISVSNIFLNNLAGQYGSNPVAAIGIVSKVTSISIMLVVGLCQGVQPLIGYNYSSGNIKRMKNTVNLTVLISFILGIVCLALFAIVKVQIINIFIKDSNIISLGSGFLLFMSISLPILGISNIGMVFFQAIGKPIQAMFLTVARQGVIYIPLLFVLKNSMQLNGIVLAQPISDFITMIITIILYMSFIMKKKKEKENVVEAVS